MRQEGHARALWGLVNRRERWGLAGRGWLVLGLALAGVTIGLCLGAHRFLALTRPVQGDVLVVEGWVPNYALEVAIDEFKRGSYEVLLTTGCQIVNGVNLESGDNQADYAAARLRWLGFDPSLIQSVPAPGVYRDRTYRSAVALRERFEKTHTPVKAVNVLTVGTHARRTWMLYRKAFGPGVKIGVISVPDREYEAARWWRYSEGVKEVLNESLSCLYTWLFFRAPEAEPTAETLEGDYENRPPPRDGVSAKRTGSLPGLQPNECV